MSFTDTPSEWKRQSRDAAVRRLLELCLSDARVCEFVHFSVEANAARLVDDYYAHGRMMVFDPPWLLSVSREILRALKA